MCVYSNSSAIICSEFHFILLKSDFAIGESPLCFYLCIYDGFETR